MPVHQTTGYTHDHDELVLILLNYIAVFQTTNKKEYTI